MKRYELTSGETLRLTLEGLDFSNAIIYLTLRNEDGIKLKKKFEINTQVAEIEISKQDAWGLVGGFDAELIVIFPTGEVIIENFVIVYKERVLSDLW